ncbi:hypothetical protein MML48_1g00077 [Holotrichia oblita]|uniref:Uncharacterized protein n=1 Tax=Holotrichia oblita TaxID=644536 RepID=A0ACB9TR32_HOLOL|nr:hypothetical protein MML48_1g00077 [Holotrichia oblita]
MYPQYRGDIRSAKSHVEDGFRPFTEGRRGGRATDAGAESEADADVTGPVRFLIEGSYGSDDDGDQQGRIEMPDRTGEGLQLAAARHLPRAIGVFADLGSGIERALLLHQHPTEPETVDVTAAHGYQVQGHLAGRHHQIGDEGEGEIRDAAPEEYAARRPAGLVDRQQGVPAEGYGEAGAGGGLQQSDAGETDRDDHSSSDDETEDGSDERRDNVRTSGATTFYNATGHP